MLHGSRLPLAGIGFRRLNISKKNGKNWKVATSKKVEIWHSSSSDVRRARSQSRLEGFQWFWVRWTAYDLYSTKNTFLSIGGRFSELGGRFSTKCRFLGQSYMTLLKPSAVLEKLPPVFEKHSISKDKIRVCSTSPKTFTKTFNELDKTQNGSFFSTTR